MRDKIIQLSFLAVLIGALAGAGGLLRPIIEDADEARLRYTDVSIEGAPPIVALGTAIGALRGLVVDYLWIKVNIMKEKGLFYEVMSDADLITKLQPRFGQVWSFHGHNMAYNVSVMTDTPEERWAWVKAGIDLVRNSGIRHNPNDLQLHKELAFWFSHKIDGVSDDAHLHYKREFAKEWHVLLGAPPYESESRLAWIKAIADAPDSLAQLEKKNPDVAVLVEELTEALAGFDTQNQFSLDKSFLNNIGMWRASKTSTFAKALELDVMFKRNDPIYQAMDDIMGDPENREAAVQLTLFLRKKVLLEEYNMDPQLMYEYTRDTGPLDWRHPQAHALYWARRGSEFGDSRYKEDDNLPKIMNNDRIFIQSMQALARTGTMNVDPFSEDNPGKLADNRWIDVLDGYFRDLYDKHYDSRGAGGDTFAGFYENFMKSAVRLLFRAGERERAQEILDRLDTLFGRGGLVPNAAYSVPLDMFVQQETYGAYLDQPWAAYGDVQAALMRGYREGLLLGREGVLEDAIKFARDLTLYFKESETFDYVNKFGEARMTALVTDLDRSIADVFSFVLIDPQMPLVDRLTIYNRAPVEQQMLVYDLARDAVEAEFSTSPLASRIDFANIFSEPEGMDAYRQMNLERNKKLLEERSRNQGVDRK
jgi:hypothetical protein